ncbi:MAG: hypothetical protein FWB88_11280, partial [Defluviitaleaceae bacterium]|nr:hypothetical protein [Defluviitaleaceae bacterium]
ATAQYSIRHATSAVPSAPPGARRHDFLALRTLYCTVAARSRFIRLYTGSVLFVQSFRAVKPAAGRPVPVLFGYNFHPAIYPAQKSTPSR